jgi:hypothetical protein
VVGAQGNGLVMSGSTPLGVQLACNYDRSDGVNHVHLATHVWIPTLSVPRTDPPNWLAPCWTWSGTYEGDGQMWTGSLLGLPSRAVALPQVHKYHACDDASAEHEEPRSKVQLCRRAITPLARR